MRSCASCITPDLCFEDRECGYGMVDLGGRANTLPSRQGVKFNEEEEVAGKLLLDFMQTLRNWGLNCNQDEMVGAIHTLQLFIIMHMLQREGEGFGDWYDGC